MSKKDSSQKLGYIIAASSVGTLIEWYDFYIFGSLATVISTKFFPSSNPSLALISTLATFAAGFVVRPFGALFFGRLGDLIGRKYTFMVTLLLMGASTFLIGLVPGYESIGVLAPLLILVFRLLQGLALGGEYGGAATYVAEHSPVHKRGFWTSWIQTTATIGLLVSLLVIALTRSSMSPEDFDSWGWRIPFLGSALVLIVSYFIRRGMHESPLFEKVKSEGKTSTNPLKESFGHKLNFKYVLLALLGATVGQGLVWYTGQFYALGFLKGDAGIKADQVESILIWAIILVTPFFVVFGTLSDKIGRKWIILAGMLLAVLSYRPIFDNMYQSVNPKNKVEIEAKKTVSDNVGKNKEGKDEFTNKVHTEYEDGMVMDVVVVKTAKDDGTFAEKKTTTKTIPSSIYWQLVGYIFILILFVTMVYGPIAAFLVELFPTKIRYTSMSLPYHIGNGVFGGLVPAISTGLVLAAKTANEEAAAKGLEPIYDKPHLEGLWYPIIVISVSFLIGLFYLSNKKRHE